MKKIGVLLILFILLLVLPVFSEEWIEQVSDTDLTLYDVHFENEYTGWIAGGSIVPSEAIILKSVDGGSSWEEKYSSTNFTLYGLCFSNFDVGWAVGSDSKILKTESGGQIWEEQELPDEIETRLTFWAVYCVNEDIAYVVGDPSRDSDRNYFGNILKTIDGGRTWNFVLSGNSNTLFDVYFINGTLGYVVGGNGDLLKTEDGGREWIQKGPLVSESGIVASSSDIYCLDSETCWVGSSGEVIYKIINGGDDWERKDTGLPVSSIKGIYFVGDDGWVVGQQNSVRYSDDDGDSWEEQMVDADFYGVNLMRDIQFVNGVGWAVGDSGLVIRYGEPFSCPEVNLTIPDCELPSFPLPTSLDNGCLGPYVCSNLEDECPAFLYEIPDCTIPAVPVYESGCLVDYVCPDEEIVNDDPCEDELNSCLGFSAASVSRDECASYTSSQICLDCYEQYDSCVAGTDLDESDEDVEEFFSSIEESSAAKFLANEKINLYFGEKVYGVVLEDKKIEKILNSEIEDNTYDVFISEETLSKIVDSENPRQDIIDALKSKEIKIKGKTIGNKFKLFFLRFSLIFV